MKSLLLIILGVGIVLNSSAQILDQPGEVRTISYEQGKKGAPVGDVRIKSKGLTEVRSTADGKFILPVKAEGGNTFTLEDLSRAGYEPVVPSREEFLSRKFAINPKAGVALILASNDQLFAERRRIEQKIRQEKEQEIADRESEISKLQAEVDKLQQENENITDLTTKIIRMEEELQKFKDSYYSSDDLIRQEAVRLSKIDFQSIDSVQAVIVNLLKEGKGGEVVTLARNQLSADLWNKIMNDPGAIKRGMELKKVELKQDSLLLEQAAKQLKNIADGFAAKYQNDSAAFYLKKRMEMDTGQLVYTRNYADFLNFTLCSYDESLKFYKKCLELNYDLWGENCFDSELYITMGKVYRKKGEFVNALDLYRNVLKCQEEFFNIGFIDANLYQSLGLVYTDLDSNSMALLYLNKSLWMFELAFGSNSTEVAIHQIYMGDVYYEMGEFSIGLEYYTKGLPILEKNGKIDLSYEYIKVGKMYKYNGDYINSLEYLQRGLDIKVSLYGSARSDVASTYNEIGSVYEKLGDNQKAIENFEKALGINEQILGYENTDIANQYNNIGNLYGILENYPKAQEYFQKSLDVRIRILGQQHPDVATSFNNLGAALFHQGLYPKSLEFYQKALSIREEIFGLENQKIIAPLINIGTAYYLLDDNTHAIECFMKALSIQEKENGLESQEVAITLKKIGMIYSSMGNKAAEIEYYERALEIEERFSGQHNPEMATSFNNLGAMYFSQANYSKAIEYNNKALLIRKYAYGTNHPSVAVSYHNLGTYYFEQGNEEESIKCYKQSLNIWESIPDQQDQSDMIFYYNKIGEWEYKHANYNEALEFYTKKLALEKRFDTTNSDSIRTKYIINKLYNIINPHIYKLDVNVDGKAQDYGLFGEYIVLAFNDWKFGDKLHLNQYAIKVKDDLKRIVLLKDEDIYEYELGSGLLGLNIILVPASTDEEKLINQKYQEWKTNRLKK